MINRKKFIVLARSKKRILAFLVIGIILLMQGTLFLAEGVDPLKSIPQDQRVLEWRKDRDEFFKTHERSPPREEKNFRGLKYFPFNSKYVYYAEIKRYIFHINDPRYYATFLTNKGTNKHYIRYGKVHFKLDGKDCSLEVYKSILSDFLFIPFKDETNGKETYEGGRYIDAEILPGYNNDIGLQHGLSSLLCLQRKIHLCSPSERKRIGSPNPGWREKP